MKNIPWICGITCVLALIVTCVGEHQRAHATVVGGSATRSATDEASSPPTDEADDDDQANPYDQYRECARNLRSLQNTRDRLNEELETTRASEARWFLMWLESQAEIERLKAENDECRELTEILGDIAVRLSEPADSDWPRMLFDPANTGAQ